MEHQKTNWNNWNWNAWLLINALKSRKSIRYDISKSSAPKMPALGRGTECIKILLSQASKDIQEPLVPMFFPVLGAHISGAKFHYPALVYWFPPVDTTKAASKPSFYRH